MSREPHRRLNALSEAEARTALARCCGAERWVSGMLARRPFASHAALFAAADELWEGLARQGWLEAFAHHPRIGAEPDAVRAQFRETSALSLAEQAGVATAAQDMRAALRAGNLAYEARFGFLYIVCAAGRSAEELLAVQRARLENPPDVELAVAAREHAAIMRRRLEQL